MMIRAPTCDKVAGQRERNRGQEPRSSVPNAARVRSLAVRVLCVDRAPPC